MHDEAGVDGELAVRARDEVGVGVAAEPVVGLVEGDVGGREATCAARQPGHAGADDGDPAGLVAGLMSGVREAEQGDRLARGPLGPAGRLDRDPGAAACRRRRRGRRWSSSSVISPAETMPLSASLIHIS